LPLAVGPWPLVANSQEWRALAVISNRPREEVEAKAALEREIARKSAPIRIARFDA
jgi:hypothetical protein